jgi:hypothetical protein
MRSPTLVVAGLAIVLTACSDPGVTQLREGGDSTAVARLEVSPSKVSLAVGAHAQLVSTVKDSAGASVAGLTVRWASKNSSVASVDASGNVTAVAAGTTKIVATVEGVEGTSDVTVTQPLPTQDAPVASVGVTPAAASVQTGATVQLAAQPRDAAGTALSGRAVAWTTSDAAVATVNSSSGLVTGVAAGTASITATSEGKQGVATVTVTAPPPPTGSGAVLVGAGDIAVCGSSDDEATATLLDNIAGAVFTLGDNVYEDGSPTEYANCYDPSWGRHKARTHPVPGNHDYHTSGAAGYYGYFGAAAGDPAKGYYSYDVGAWHVVVLNSNISRGTSSAQLDWLRADLAAHTNRCTVAMWHHPRFSSGDHGNDTSVGPFWDALYAANADLILNGHEHDYERFAPQTPAGVADATRGIPEIIAGTGGTSLRSFSSTIETNSVFRNKTDHGVLKLELLDGGYRWSFVTTPSAVVKDSGEASCH